MSTATEIIGHFKGDHADLVVCDGAPDGMGLILYDMRHYGASDSRGLILYDMRHYGMPDSRSLILYDMRHCRVPDSMG